MNLIETLYSIARKRRPEMNLIETLKHNERPFGLLSEDEQRRLAEVGREHCELYDIRRLWEPCSGSGTYFDPTSTYRIKPDYQSEPQVEKCEVKPYGVGQLGYCRSDDSRWRYLHEALSDPDFMYFEYNNGESDLLPRIIGDTRQPAPIPKYVLFVKRSI